MILPTLFAIAGVIAAPILYHLAARAGVWAPFAGGRPACEDCGEALRGWGWGARSCHVCARPRRIRREVITALVSAVLFFGAGSISGNPPVMVAHLILAGVSVILLVTDIDHKLIPNRILFPGGGLAVVVLGLGAIVGGSRQAFAIGLVTGLGYFALFYLVAVVARGGFGFGDVKLAALLGTFTGYQGWRYFAMSLFLTGMIGGIPAIVLLVTGRAKAKYELPYGPAMIAGAWISLVFGDYLIARA